MNNRAIIGVAAIMLIIGVAIGALSFPKTKTETTTETYNITSALHQVTFIQRPACQPDDVYVTPWSVTLGNQTKAQQPNGTDTNEVASGANVAFSQIVFLVPNGIYNYSATPNGYAYWPLEYSSGTVSVAGSDVTVQVGPAEVDCINPSFFSMTQTTTTG